MRLSEYWTYLKNIEEEKADQIEEIKRRSEANRNDIKNSVSLDSHIKTKDNIILVDDGLLLVQQLLQRRDGLKETTIQKDR
jgi:predicted phosphoribosyltransferase